MIERGQPTDRKPTCSGGHPNGKQGKKEFGNGQSKVGSGRGDAIDPSPWACGGEDSQRNGQGPREKEGGKAEEKGGWSTLGDELCDGNLVGPGVTKIEMQDIPQPKCVLFIPRTIQAKGFLQLRD